MADIYLIGTGIDPLRHLTPEAIRALSACERVYHLTAFHDVIAAHARETVDWRELYLSSSSADVYAVMAETLLDDAEERSVGFAVYGHPLVFVSTSRIVVQRAPERSLDVTIVPGISSVDVLLEMLQLDAGLAGLQIYDPNFIIQRDIRPDPRSACLILQVASVGATGLNGSPVCSSDQLAELRDHLLQSGYAARHPAVYVLYPYLHGAEEVRSRTTVGELDSPSVAVHTGMSLYLPPRLSAPRAAEGRVRTMPEQADV